MWHFSKIAKLRFSHQHLQFFFASGKEMLLVSDLGTFLFSTGGFYLLNSSLLLLKTNKNNNICKKRATLRCYIYLHRSIRTLGDI